jgi:hypothetical protein
MAKHTPPAPDRTYDVCLSFAGEDRAYVEKVARLLRVAGVRTFYDNFEQGRLWGKDLYSHLHDIYQNKAQYCVVFLSLNYARKAWSNHERRSAQARALGESVEYILPCRFDDTEIQGITNTIGYIDLRSTTPAQLTQLVVQKLGPRPRLKYFPPVPDRLFKKLGARSIKRQASVTYIAHCFFGSLQKTNDEERGVIFDFFTNACPAELPENVHISVDYLRRITGIPVAKLKKLLFGIRSLGFYVTIRQNDDPEDGHSNQPVFALEWHNMSLVESGNFTGLANDIVDCTTDEYCQVHGREMFARLDFGQLATSTIMADQH